MNFTYKKKIHKKKIELEALQLEIKDLQNKFDNDIDIEIGSHLTLNILSDKMQIISEKILKKQEEIDLIILEISN